MAIGDDFSVAANGAVRHTSGTGRYSVLELHRWLQDLADDASSAGDDELDVTSEIDPSSKQYDTIVTLNAPYNIDADAAQYLYGGSITQDGGNTIYAGVKIQFLVTPFTSDVYVEQDGARLTFPSFLTGLLEPVTDTVQFMVLIRSGGTTIDGGNVRFYARDLGNTYSDFQATLGVGETSVALGPGADVNVDSGAGATYASNAALLTIEFGTYSYDNGSGAGARDYDCRVTVPTSLSPLEVYQSLQYLLRNGSTTTINAVQGQLYRLADTGYTPYPAAPLATLQGSNLVGAQGVLFVGFHSQYAQNFIPRDDTGVTQTPPNSVPVAVNDCAVGDYISVTRTITGNYTASGSQAAGASTVVVNEAISTALPQVGRVLVNGDEYAYTSFSGSTFSGVTPPLTTTYSDSAPVVVTAVNRSEFSLAAGNNSGNGTLVVNETIGADHPSSGYVRVDNPSTGRFDRYAYTSFSGSTFTLSGTLLANYVLNDRAYVPFLDQVATSTSESTTIVQSTPIPVRVRVRRGSAPFIVPFQVPGVIGAAGLQVTAIRQSDA